MKLEYWMQALREFGAIPDMIYRTITFDAINPPVVNLVNGDLWWDGVNLNFRTGGINYVITGQSAQQFGLINFAEMFIGMGA